MNKQALIGYTGKLTKMADESVRLYIDFAETDLVQVATLFGRGGTKVAIAVMGEEINEVPVVEEKLKGGELAKGAAILCRNRQFQQFIDAFDEAGAAVIICDHCEINSRSELDHNTLAADKYRQIVASFNKSINL